MKTVFSNTGMVAHVWAQQSQSEGHNSNRTIYFKEGTIYSYGDHFPLATFVKDKDSQDIVIFNNDTYSVTTSKHQRDVRQSARHYPFVYVNTAISKVISEWHDSVADEKRAIKSVALNYLNRVFITQANSAIKRRAAHLIASDIQTARSAYDNIVKLFSVYGINMPVAVSRKVDALDNDLESVLASHKKEIAAQQRKRDKEAEQRKQRREIAAKTAVQTFISGGNLSHEERNALRYIDKTYMRPQDDGNIHTTQNASFPIEHAKKAFAAIRHCKETASEWKRNGKSIHLGHFQIDTIESNGNVKAGCHYIEWDEIARIARQLDIYPHK